MDPGEERDEHLMARVAEGLTEPLERVVRRHASPRRPFIQRRVGARHRSEELFQEVFLAVWVRRGQYEPRRPFRPWLYAIAVNKCREVFRLRAPPVHPL